MNTVRTTVAIVGAGPAGLLLGHRLAAAGIDFVIVEARSRDHILSRVRAGVLEEASVDVLSSLGLDGRLKERGMVHNGIYLQYEGERHHVDFHELIGRTVTVYGQQQVVGDLMEAHDAGHIVPPTGAKGLNAAISDVAMLGAAFDAYFHGDPAPLSSYSDRALARQWKTQYFSRWMTEMLHTSGTGADGDFRYRGQVGQLEYVTGSRFALQGLAEQYTGLPIEGL